MCIHMFTYVYMYTCQMHTYDIAYDMDSAYKLMYPYLALLNVRTLQHKAEQGHISL